MGLFEDQPSLKKSDQRHVLKHNNMSATSKAQQCGTSFYHYPLWFFKTLLLIFQERSVFAITQIVLKLAIVQQLDYF